MSTLPTITIIGGEPSLIGWKGDMKLELIEVTADIFRDNDRIMVALHQDNNLCEDTDLIVYDLDELLDIIKASLERFIEDGSV